MLPVFGVTLYVITPFPPLVCTLYSFNSVLFPNPFSVIASNVAVLSTRIDSIPITQSSLSSLIPITPWEALPIGLTSFSLNVIDIPSFVTRTTLSSPSVNLTAINSSSSFNVIDKSPVFLAELYSDKLVFLMIPFFVANNKYLPSAKFCIGIIADIFSPLLKLNKLTIAVPLAVLPASGISYPLNL